MEDFKRELHFAACQIYLNNYMAALTLFGNQVRLDSLMCRSTTYSDEEYARLYQLIAMDLGCVKLMLNAKEYLRPKIDCSQEVQEVVIQSVKDILSTMGFSEITVLSLEDVVGHLRPEFRLLLE